jgi:hypothetical protein
MLMTRREIKGNARTKSYKSWRALHHRLMVLAKIKAAHTYRRNERSLVRPRTPYACVVVRGSIQRLPPRHRKMELHPRVYSLAWGGARLPMSRPL